MSPITKELLQKYIDGTCTEQEKQIVMQWLSSVGDDEPSGNLLLPDEEFSAEKEIIWRDLSQHIAPPRRKAGWPGRHVFRYAAAASLLLAIGWTGYVAYNDEPLESKIAYSNANAFVSHTIQTFGLGVTLLPGSEVEVVNGNCFTPGSMRLCGDMVLENKRRCDVDFSVNSCNTPDTRLMTLKAGRKYVALRPNKRSPDLLIVDVSKQRYGLTERESLPPLLRKVNAILSKV